MQYVDIIWSNIQWIYGHVLHVNKGRIQNFTEKTFFPKETLYWIRAAKKHQLL